MRVHRTARSRSLTAALLTCLPLLATAPLQAQTITRPPPPEVTVGANLKELTFDWEPVPGAYTYRLLEKLNQNAYYTAVGNRIPASRPRATHPVAVHLQDWDETTYVVQACNEAGCTRSNGVSPEHLMLETIGYVKPSNTGAQDRFGNVIALSSDGSTMAVAAPREASSASGIHGNQADNSSPQSGAVYVYRRTGRRWAQEAYVKAGANQPQQQFGAALAISGDGSILAVGAPGQDVTEADSGAVFVYQRAADNSWHLIATLLGPDMQAGNAFGYSVDLSLDGRTLKVSSRLPLDEGGQPQGRIHIYGRPNATWGSPVTLAPHYLGDRCPSSRMSTDGRTLVSSCYAGTAGQLRLVTRRYVNGAWAHVSTFPLASNLVEGTLALDHRGERMAVTVQGMNISNCPARWITVHRWQDGNWIAEGGLGRPFSFTCPTQAELDGFGGTMAFDKYGQSLVLGDWMNTSAGIGVADRGIIGTEYRGQAFLIERKQSGANFWWEGRTAIHATNPQLDDRFATAVAISGNARIIAVGAIGEDSAARGIDGNQASEASQNSGAVYLY
jgi:hypothetical protein